MYENIWESSSKSTHNQQKQIKFSERLIKNNFSFRCASQSPIRMRSCRALGHHIGSRCCSSSRKASAPRPSLHFSWVLWAGPHVHVTLHPEPRVTHWNSSNNPSESLLTLVETPIFVTDSCDITRQVIYVSPSTSKPASFFKQLHQLC